MKKRGYPTIAGRTLELGRLGDEERKFLGAVQRKYARGLECSEFAAWWGGEFRRSGLPEDSLVSPERAAEALAAAAR